MKKILLAVFLCLLVAIGGCLCWLRYGSGSYIAGLIKEYSQKFSGNELKLSAEPEIRLFPPALVLSGLDWSDPAIDCRFAVNSVKVSVNLFSLFMEEPFLSEILLDGPVLNLDLEKLASAPKNTGATRGNSQLPFEAGRLVVQKAAFFIKSKGKEYACKEGNFLADNLRARQESELSGNFIVTVTERGAGDKPEPLSGNLAFRAQTRYYQPNLTLKQAAITFTATEGPTLMWLSPLQLAFDGAINFDNFNMRISSASINSTVGKANFKGNAAPTQGQFSGQCTLALLLNKILGQKSQSASDSALYIDSSVRFEDNSLFLSDIAIKEGKTEGSGNLVFRLPQKNEIASLSGALSFRNLELWPSDGGNGRNVESKNVAATTSTPPFSSFPEISLRFGAENFRYGKFAADKVAGVLTGKQASYFLRDASLNWVKGAIKADGTCDFKNNFFKIKASGKGINAGQAMEQAGFQGFTGGSANFAADLSSHGLDLNSIAQTLNGSANFSANDVRINLLEKIAAFLPAKMAENSFPDVVQTLMANLVANNGSIKVDPLKLEAKSLQAAGQANYTAINGHISGNLDLKLGSISLPLAFHGPGNDISWNVSGGFLKQLLHDLP